VVVLLPSNANTNTTQNRNKDYQTNIKQNKLRK
jgi:hypothetical protein